MTLEISGRNYEVTDRIRKLTATRFRKIEKYFTDIIEARCVLQIEKHDSICEMYVVGKDYDVKSMQRASTMEDAIVSTIDHLKRQAEKNHNRIIDHRRKKNAGKPGSPPESWLVQVLEPGRLRDEEKKIPRIVKTNNLPIRPMSIEEAALKLGDSKNEFIVFRDLDTDRVSVLYKRQDDNFGLIATEV